jgi:subtilisin family serine protease
LSSVEDQWPWPVRRLGWAKGKIRIRQAKLSARLALAAIWLFFLLCGRVAAEEKGSSPLVEASAPKRLLIQAKPGKPLQHLHERHGTRLIKRFADLEVDVVEACGEGQVCDLIEQYRADEEVETAEPDFLVKAQLAPNDPSYVDGLLWALHNYGQDGGLAGADLDAPDAWDGIRIASRVIVAVIDTGVRYTHEDLAPNIWTNQREIAGNKLDDDGNGYIDDLHGINAITGSGDPMDDCGHGTHIAGIIGAAGNNGRGIVGVAWQVQILPCKFMKSTGEGAYSDAIECIEYARKAGAQIINASWGGPQYSAALQKAVATAQAAGIIFVTAAGNTASNNDKTPFYPACFGLDNIVAVAATTRADLLASDYSNYGGASVQVAAPGTGIYSTWYSSDEAYASLNGTSMAAAYVSGILALVQARFPEENYHQHLHRLIAGCDLLPGLTGKCVSGGRVNLRKALGLPSLKAVAPPPALSVAGGHTPATIQFQLTGQPGESYAIEVSLGLLNWAPVLTNTLSGSGVLSFNDPCPRSYPSRFFRAKRINPTVQLGP